MEETQTEMQDTDNEFLSMEPEPLAQCQQQQPPQSALDAQTVETSSTSSKSKSNTRPSRRESTQRRNNQSEEPTTAENRTRRRGVRKTNNNCEDDDEAEDEDEDEQDDNDNDNENDDDPELRTLTSVEKKAKKIKSILYTVGTTLTVIAGIFATTTQFISGFSSFVSDYFPQNHSNTTLLNSSTLDDLRFRFDLPNTRIPSCPRDAVISELHKTLQFEEIDQNLEGESTVKTDRIFRVAVVTGVAGSGKTELLKLYIQNFDSQYCQVVWIDGRNQFSIRESMEKLLEAIESKENAKKEKVKDNDNDKDKDKYKKLSIEEILQKVYSKLIVGPCPTLIVFDDFDAQRRDLRLYNYLHNHVPQTKSMSQTKTFVVVTTQNPELQDGDAVHELLLLDELTIDESIDCIQRQLTRQMDPKDVQLLARQQKGLPGNIIKAVEAINGKLAAEEVHESKRAVNDHLNIYDGDQTQLSVPVIQPIKSDNVEVNLTAFDLVLDKVGDRPFVLISINGASRTGKSFLLSYFLRYLKFRASLAQASSSSAFSSDPPNDKSFDFYWFETPISQEFSWRPGATRETLGCHLWSEPFIVRGQDGREIAVLLMDSQGLFDGRTSRKENNQIFTLSTLLSSIMIYNVMGQVDDSTVANLQDYTREARNALGGRSSSNLMPQLLVLLRDFMHTNEFHFGLHDQNFPDGKNSANNYYRQFLHPSLRPEILAARKEVRNSFEQFAFFLLPDPGNSFKKSSSPTSLDSKFKLHLKDFIKLVSRNLEKSTKKVFGLEMTGLQFKSYLKHAVEHIGAPNEDLPDWHHFYEKTRENFEKKHRTIWRKLKDGVKGWARKLKFF